jgi:hypothetical protein
MSPLKVIGLFETDNVVELTPMLVTVPPAVPEIPTFAAPVILPLESTVNWATEDGLPYTPAATPEATKVVSVLPAGEVTSPDKGGIRTLGSSPLEMFPAFVASTVADRANVMLLTSVTCPLAFTANTGREAVDP